MAFPEFLTPEAMPLIVRKIVSRSRSARRQTAVTSGDSFPRR